MKVAIVGSRNLNISNLEEYLPEQVTEIVSGGAKGVDACAQNYAIANGIPLKEFFPAYSQYGRAAPLRRNMQIVEYADVVLVFWDGKSRGTKFTIDYCAKLGKEMRIVRMSS